VIWPLLDLSRPELEEWLGERGLAFRLDASNQDERFTRNRIRHQVLPALTAAVSPRVLEALARAARLAADEDEFLEEAVTQAARTVVLSEGAESRADLAGLLALPLALRRRLVWRALERASGGRPIGAAHVEVVLAGASGGDGHGGRLDLPGQWVVVGGGTLTFRPRGPADDPGEVPATPPGLERTPLPVPGTLADPKGRWAVSVALAARDTVRDGWPAGAERAVADAAVGTELFVRTRRPGDRLAPVGLGGHKKLQDLFVDRKVPRMERDSVPLVVDGRDRIIWVAGHALSRDARVTAGTTSVLLFEIRRSGGQG
jgi:tRNA(Ile)-lysidine synthase